MTKTILALGICVVLLLVVLAFLEIVSSVVAGHTAMFIEEIENNQHPESLKKLIPFLIRLSKENNLQVFLTTHNAFVWNLLEAEFSTPTERKSNFQCYHVVRDRNTGTVDCTPQTKEAENQFWSSVYKNLYGK